MYRCSGITRGEFLWDRRGCPDVNNSHQSISLWIELGLGLDMYDFREERSLGTRERLDSG